MNVSVLRNVCLAFRIEIFYELQLHPSLLHRSSLHLFFIDVIFSFLHDLGAFRKSPKFEWCDYVGVIWSDCFSPLAWADLK